MPNPTVALVARPVRAPIARRLPALGSSDLAPCPAALMENSCANGRDAPVRARVGLLILAVVATVALVAIGARHSSLSVLYLAAAATAAGVLAHLEWRRPLLDVRVVVGAIAVVFLVAVVMPPRTSNDLWSYTSYGRMLGLRGVSPYTHVPADYRGDPFLHRVSVIWRHRSSVFGPLWNGWSTLGALTAGSSVLLARLFFQLTAAAAASRRPAAGVAAHAQPGSAHLARVATGRGRRRDQRRAQRPGRRRRHPARRDRGERRVGRHGPASPSRPRR